MKSIQNSSQLILKVFSGVQSGVEVALTEGEYTIGSGQNDDLQFVDVLLKSGHARLRIKDGKIAVAGGAGGLSTGAGLQIEAGDEEWQDIEPLELLTVGGISVAIGGVEEKWAELAAQMEQRQPKTSDTAKSRSKRPKEAKGLPWGRYAAAAVGGLFLLVSVFWFVVPELHASGDRTGVAQSSDFQRVRAALDAFPFGQPVGLREEVDGALFVEGYVEEPVEQRALKNAIEDTGVLVHLRLWVLDSIRTKIDATIANQKVDVNYQLSGKGEVTFSGTILSEADSKRFLNTIKHEVLGLSDIAYDVKTANTYFEEIKQLSARSGIDDTVLFLLDGERIEASGVVVTAKIDAWVGFIQAYARRYADFLPLTSYVQLVNEQGQVLAQGNPTILGASAVVGNGQTDNQDPQPKYVLDLEKLKRGSFSAEDVFQGLETNLAANNADQPVITNSVGKINLTGDMPVPVSNQRSVSNPLALTQAEGDLAASARELLVQQATKTTGQDDSAVDGPDPTTGPTDEAYDITAERVLDRWDTALRKNSSVLVEDVSETGAATDEKLRNKYLPLIMQHKGGGEQCWAGSVIKESDVATVLFWLDFLSMTTEMSLINLDKDSQYLLLEAALSPDRMRKCAQRVAEKRDIPLHSMSLYLDEAERNPAFVRFLVRDFRISTLDITGVMLRERVRYLQMKNGVKIREGSSPDVSSKLASVGALGALMQSSQGLAPVIYSDDLAWKAFN